MHQTNLNRVFQQIQTLSLSTLYEAYSGKMLSAIAGVLALGFTLAMFLGDVAITETAQVQQALLAGFLRVGLVFVLAVFVVNSSVREMQERSLLLLLSMPISRTALFFGKFTAYMVIACIVVVLACLELSVFAPLEHTVTWGVTLWLESMLVVTFALVCAFSFGQVPLAITAVVGFYLLSRRMIAVQLIAHYPLIQSGSLGQAVLTFVADAMTYLLPDLDKFARAEYLVYGAGSEIQMIPMLLHGVMYIALLASIALFDLYRKNF